MPAFSITPAGSFPAPASESGDTGFVNFIQFQQDGTNLGDANADTVNFTGSGVTATRGTGENSGVLTVDIAGGGGAAAVLVVDLLPVDQVLLNGVDFSDWVGTPVVESTDTTWDDVNGITFLNAGVYEIAIGVRAQGESGVLPDDGTYYGTYVSPSAGQFNRSRYAITKVSAQLGNMSEVAWSDVFTVVATEGQQFLPVVYARNYIHDTNYVSFYGTLTVRKVS